MVQAWDLKWAVVMLAFWLEQVLGQRLMRAACVRKQVDDLKKEFAKKFRQKGGRGSGGRLYQKHAPHTSRARSASPSCVL